MHVDFDLSKVRFTHFEKNFVNSKLINSKFFFLMFFSSRVEHSDERPYAKFKQNLTWNFRICLFSGNSVTMATSSSLRLWEMNTLMLS